MADETYRPNPLEVLGNAWGAFSNLMGKQWPTVPGPLPRGRPPTEPTLDQFTPEPSFFQAPQMSPEDTFKEVLYSMAPGMGLAMKGGARALSGTLRSGVTPDIGDIPTHTDLKRTIRNTEVAPNMGATFGQDIEPTGRYLSPADPGQDLSKLPAGFEAGTQQFRNPLVIDWGSGGYADPDSWKRVLSERYSGKTGEELSRAIAKDGYDGIVTTRGGAASEMVDLSSYTGRGVDVSTGRQGATMPMKHYSQTPGIETIEANRYGTGMPGAEAARLNEAPGLKQRSYAYTDLERAPESGVGAHRYDFEGSNIYDLEADSRDYRGLANRLLTEENAADNVQRLSRGQYPLANPVDPARRQNMTEQMIRDAGYEGHTAQGVAVNYKDVPLENIPTQVETIGHHIEASTGVGAGAGKAQRRYAGGEQAGDYVGAPQKVTNPSRLGHMRRRVMDLAFKGTPGRYWYEQSGQAIHKGYSGDPGRTQGFTGALAITSPSTNVSTNTNFGILASNQAAAGDPLRAGIFPGPMSPKLDKVLNQGETLAGRKVSSFYGNILHDMFPDIPQGVTADMWMSRAFGFDRDALTRTQFDFIEREVENVIVPRLNEALPKGAPQWDKKQVQAAIWTQMKHATENIPIERAAESFSEGIAGRMAQLPLETMPGKTSGILPGMHDATTGQKQLLQDDLMTNVLLDDFGNNVVMREMGALQAPAVGGTGVFEGALSPVTTGQMAVAKIPGRTWQDAAVDEGLGSWTKGQGKWGEVDTFQARADLNPVERAQLHWQQNKVDASSRKMMDAAAATQAKLLGQDAGSWVRVFSDKTVPRAAQDAAVLKLDMTPTQVQALESALMRASGDNRNPYPIVRTADGYTVINPGKPGAKYSTFENADFHKHLEAALGTDDLPDMDVAMFSHDGNYFENNWSRQGAGEGYDEVIRGSGETLAAKSATIQEQMAPRIAQRQQFWEQNLGMGP